MKKIINHFVLLLFTLSFFSCAEEDKNTKFTDIRDGRVYKTVKIDNQIWMAENLAYKPKNGKCWIYDNKQANLVKYGYFYDWETAEKACPKGWRLPEKKDFQKLLMKFGDDEKATFKALISEGESGFSVFFGGCSSKQGKFYDKDEYASFWSGTENGNNKSWRLNIGKISKKTSINEVDKEWGFSVRCIQDINE